MWRVSKIPRIREVEQQQEEKDMYLYRFIDFFKSIKQQFTR